MNNKERIDDTLIDGIKIIQRSDWFSYGIDAVLLADFCDIKVGKKVIDLGTGTGIIPLLLSSFTKLSLIEGIDIQERMVHMAKRSIALNGLENRISVHHMDIKEATTKLGKNKYDVVLCNPPYMAADEGIQNTHLSKAISRHELAVSLEDVIKTASELLCDSGKFFMVHRPHRLVDIFESCRKYRLEPKTVRLVHPSIDKPPNIVLIKCSKYGNKELKFMKPLYVYNQNGDYTKDILKIYRRI